MVKSRGWPQISLFSLQLKIKIYFPFRYRLDLWERRRGRRQPTLNAHQVLVAAATGVLATSLNGDTPAKTDPILRKIAASNRIQVSIPRTVSLLLFSFRKARICKIRRRNPHYPHHYRRNLPPALHPRR